MIWKYSCNRSFHCLVVLQAIIQPSIISTFLPCRFCAKFRRNPSGFCKQDKIQSFEHWHKHAILLIGYYAEFVKTGFQISSTKSYHAYLYSSAIMKIDKKQAVVLKLNEIKMNICYSCDDLRKSLKVNCASCNNGIRQCLPWGFHTIIKTELWDIHSNFWFR